MLLYQLINARCNPSFAIDKDGKKLFSPGDAAGYGWFGISEKMIKNDVMLNLADDIEHRLMNSFAQNSYLDEFNKVRSSFAYTRVHSGDKVIPIWAYLYIQNDGRGSGGRHFLVGEGGEGIAPCRMLTSSASCWDDSQTRDMYDGNPNRAILSEIDDSKIENLLPEPSVDKEYFTPEKMELLDKALYFVMEQISLINYKKKPEQAKTLIIRETPENTLLWINAITHRLNPGYVSMFTFSSNVSDIASNSKERLLNEKEGNAPYFIIAGAHPEDRTVNFDTDGERYMFMDPKKGSFAYNPNLNNPFFTDNETKIALFWQGLEKLPSPMEALFQYDWQSKEGRLESLEYNEYLTLLSNPVKDKSAIKKIYDSVRERPDLDESDYKNNFALFNALKKNYPHGKKDILLRQIDICLQNNDYDKAIHFFNSAEKHEILSAWDKLKKYFDCQLQKISEAKPDAEKYAGYAADFLRKLSEIADAEKRPKLQSKIFALAKKFLESSEASAFFKIDRGQKKIQNSELFPVFKKCLNSLELEELKEEELEKITVNLAALLDKDIEKMIDQIKGSETEAGLKEELIISLACYAADIEDENIRTAIYKVLDKKLPSEALKIQYGKKYIKEFKTKYNAPEPPTHIEEIFMDYYCSNGGRDMKSALAARRAYQSMLSSLEKREFISCEKTNEYKGDIPECNYNGKANIEKSKRKSAALAKKAMKEAVKEHLKNHPALMPLKLDFKDLFIDKTGMFILKKSFSVVSILLIVFCSIIATYWPMHSLYNASVIPLIETNMANVLTCKPFNKNNQEQKGVFKCYYEAEKLKETTRKETKSVENVVQSVTENTDASAKKKDSWLKRKWPRLYSLIFFWEKDVPNKKASIKPTDSEISADTSVKSDKKMESITANEKTVENPEQISQGQNNNEQGSQAKEQKNTDSEKSVQQNLKEETQKQLSAEVVPSKQKINLKK